MTSLECDGEIRKVQLTKEIAIAEAEEKAINEALIDERKQIAIKKEPLNSLVSSFIPISTLHHTRETAETKPKYTPTHAQDNPDTATGNFAVKQEINLTNSQPVNYETPFQKPLGQLADQTSRT